MQGKKYILGINLPLKSRCHEAGVALIDLDGNILYAANEERFSRKKLDGDFPELSISNMLEFTGISREDIIFAAIPSLAKHKKKYRFLEFLLKERLTHLFKPTTYKSIYKLFAAEKNAAQVKGQNQKKEFVMRYYWRDFLQDSFPKARIVEVDHHLAHAAGAYFTSPWDDALIVTCDGAGNLLSSIIAKGKKDKIKIIDKSFVPHSLGSFWGSVTKVCGFQSGTRHGGKVTGLAASGDASKHIDKIRQVIWADGMKIKIREDLFFDSSKLIPDWNSYMPEKLKEYLDNPTREDLAAAAQLRLEEVMTEIVKNANKKTTFSKVVLAGGVFANVLLNQKILELPFVEDIYVFPAMSDGGLALGSALQFLADLYRVNYNSAILTPPLEKGAGGILDGNNDRTFTKTLFLPRPLKSVYLGPSYTDEAIEKALAENNIKYRKMTAPAQEVAELIHKDKVIALYQNRMEYGPRALGSRSIIYAPKDPEVNNWLNKKLNRSEFMPFAPVTLKEHIKENYFLRCHSRGGGNPVRIEIPENPLAAKYMTVTYHCTDKMKKDAPACVHLDGTARPQVISREQNPYYYDIISEYYKLSNIPTVINTSFNMHEEPIVCSPQDAIRAFLDSGLDYLVMENYLCSWEENQGKN